MMQAMIGFWDAVPSAGPYANNLHLAPDRYANQHLIAQFLQAGSSEKLRTEEKGRNNKQNKKTNKPSADSPSI